MEIRLTKRLGWYVTNSNFIANEQEGSRQYRSTKNSRLGGVVGLSLPTVPKVAGSTPAQVDGFSRCRKSTAAMSYDYTARKRYLGGTLGKIKF
ncbi:hypothetical protein TNCV_4527901 [Trichonephila clavipes]|nr:hypothetical protein TNCV_4527901 [Trichonephila clavipes]